MKLFAEVNRELIEDDAYKKRRGKKTSRYPITKFFIEATECMEHVIKFTKEIKIISLSELKDNLNAI